MEIRSMSSPRNFGRRRLLKQTAFACLGLAGGACFAGKLRKSLFADAFGGELPVVSAQNPSDADILNFALNLEYLEAELFTIATTGKTLEESNIPVHGVGDLGATTGGKQINFLSANSSELANAQAIAQQLAYDEQGHVLALRGALGDLAIAKPEINLNARGPADTLVQFLALAREFEDVAGSTYMGTMALLQSKAIQDGASQIIASKNRDVANIRLLIALNGATTNMPTGSSNLLPPPSGPHYFTPNATRNVARTPSQVLSVVYGNTSPGTTCGCFFPKGVNGVIRAV